MPTHRRCLTAKIFLWTLALGVCAFALAAFMAVALFSRWERDLDANGAVVPELMSDEGVARSDEVARVELLNPGTARTLAAAAAWAAAALVAVGIVAIFCKRWKLAVAVSLLAVIGFPACHFVAALRVWLPWTVMSAEVRAPDGHMYGLAGRGYGNGQFAIFRVERQDRFTRTLSVLGTVWDHGPAPERLPMVRPASPRADVYRWLHQTDSGLLLGLARNECCLAYDTATGRFYGTDDVVTLSPFLLIGETGALHQPDVDALLKWTRESLQLTASRPESERSLAGPRPSRKALTDALTHPNPAVRELAAQLLAIHREFEPPPATQPE